MNCGIDEFKSLINKSFEIINDIINTVIITTTQQIESIGFTPKFTIDEARERVKNLFHNILDETNLTTEYKELSELYKTNINEYIHKFVELFQNTY